jgi:mono/diheme cytochrome c family protein
MFKLLILLVYLVPNFSYADSTVGESLFNRNCATCHKRTAPNIIGTKLNSSTFLMIVKNGRAGTMMGSFKRKFSDDEILDIYSYLSGK